MVPLFDVFPSLTTEAKTGFLFAGRPFLATARMWLSDSLFAEGLNPHRRLSKGDSLS